MEREPYNSPGQDSNHKKTHPDCPVEQALEVLASIAGVGSASPPLQPCLDVGPVSHSHMQVLQFISGARHPNFKVVTVMVLSLTSGAV